MAKYLFVFNKIIFGPHKISLLNILAYIDIVITVDLMFNDSCPLGAL